jgi:hypothetical protein
MYAQVLCWFGDGNTGTANPHQESTHLCPVAPTVLTHALLPQPSSHPSPTQAQCSQLLDTNHQLRQQLSDSQLFNQVEGGAADLYEYQLGDFLQAEGA